MAKTRLSLLGLSIVTVLGLSACVQQLWTAKYPGPNNYFSQVYAVVEGIDQAVFVEGRTNTADNSSTLFVAKYDSNGSLLWDYLIPDYMAVSEGVVGTSSLKAVNNGNVFVSGAHIDGQVWKILTLSSQGELLWERDFEFDSQWRDIAVSNEGISYLLGWFESKALVMAFDELGNDLWQYQVGEVASEDPDVDLPDYGSRLVKGFSAGHMEVAEDGRIVVNMGTELLILNADGSLNNSVLANELGVDFFLDHSISENSIALLGEGFWEDNIIAFILDENLTIKTSSEVGKDVIWGSIVMLGDSSACVSFTKGYTGSVTHSIGLVSATEEEWAYEKTAEYAFYSPISLKADDQHCYLSTIESVATPITSYTYRYNEMGKLVDTIRLKDFFLFAIELSGSNIYSGGITGEYFGVDGTVATIVKHKIK